MFNDIIEFIKQYPGVFTTVLSILVSQGGKAYSHIKNNLRERATSLEPKRLPYSERRRKITAAHSKYRKRPRHNRRSRSRKKT